MKRRMLNKISISLLAMPLLFLPFTSLETKTIEHDNSSKPEARNEIADAFMYEGYSRIIYHKKDRDAVPMIQFIEELEIVKSPGSVD